MKAALLQLCYTYTLLLCLTETPTPSLAGTLARHGQPGRRSNPKLGSAGGITLLPPHHHHLRRQQTVRDSIYDPSIFERTLDAQDELEERQRVAREEDWYGARFDDDPIEDDEEEELSSRYRAVKVVQPGPHGFSDGEHWSAQDGRADEEDELAGYEPGTQPEPEPEGEDLGHDPLWSSSPAGVHEHDVDTSAEDDEGGYYRHKRAYRGSSSRKGAAARGQGQRQQFQQGRTSPKKSKKVASSPRKTGLLGYVDQKAGPSGATAKTTKRSGPNGSQAWLNNGISKVKRTSKWSPPSLRLSQLKTVSLTDALKDPRSPFHACKRYLPLFNAAAKRHNLPPILLASLAMQESSCNPDAMGDNGGAHGLMQLITENCKGRGGKACRDPRFNIDTAAALFANNLEAAGGNVIVSLASYNGWYRGMSYKAATRAAKSQCCHCQQNLDYLHQMLNGWLLNISPYEHRLGLLRNLDVCGPE